MCPVLRKSSVLSHCWHRRPNLHGSHKCQTGSVKGVVDPITGNALLKVREWYFFSAAPSSEEKELMWPKQMGLWVVCPLFYHPEPGVMPLAFTWLFSSMGIELWTSGHPGPQPWSPTQADHMLLQWPPHSQHASATGHLCLRLASLPLKW